MFTKNICLVIEYESFNIGFETNLQHYQKGTFFHQLRIWPTINQVTNTRMPQLGISHVKLLWLQIILMWIILMRHWCLAFTQFLGMFMLNIQMWQAPIYPGCEATRGFLRGSQLESSPQKGLKSPSRGHSGMICTYKTAEKDTFNYSTMCFWVQIVPWTGWICQWILLLSVRRLTVEGQAVQNDFLHLANLVPAFEKHKPICLYWIIVT